MELERRIGFISSSHGSYNIILEGDALYRRAFLSIL